jgi:hypothetical protein
VQSTLLLRTVGLGASEPDVDANDHSDLVLTFIVERGRVLVASGLGACDDAAAEIAG